MVKERVLAVPDTSIFIAELPEATRNIIRKDLEEHAREHHYRLEWDLKNKRLCSNEPEILRYGRHLYGYPSAFL